MAVYSRVSIERRTRSTTTRRPQAFPASNYGLTLRDGMHFGAGQESNNNNGFGISALPARGPRTKALGIASVGSIRFPPSTHGGAPQLQNGSSRGHIRFREQMIQQTSASIGEESVPVANTAKRRKTHGGMTTFSYGLNGQGLNGKDIQTNTIQISDFREVSTISSSSDASLVEITRPPPVLNGSRIPSHARKEPPKPQTYRLSQVSDRRPEERVLEALDTQLFKHVKSALQKFRKTLSRVERIQIATKVRRKYLN